MPILSIKKERKTMSTPVKATKLKELGYKVTTASGKDDKGNEFVFKVTGPTPVFYIKQTKKGRLVAVKDKTSTTESTIEGLYNFKVVGEGENADLEGQRATSQAKAPTHKAA